MPGLVFRSAQFLYSRLRKVKNLALNRLDPPVIVLLYHRVTTLPSDPELLAVTPENFEAQMRYLKENFALVRFEEDWAKAERPAVCVTFDDGYADNFLEALPILEETGVPATFFVSTGTVGTSREFWWHELERILLQRPELPDNFVLTVGGRRKTGPSWTASEREELFRDCVQLLTAADKETREQHLAELRAMAGERHEDAGPNRALTVDELRKLAASDLVTVGAHTVSHCQLSSLTAAAQRDEIATSKRQLEQWLGKSVPVFSYPYGRRNQYTRRTIALCREAGFIKTAANFPGQAHRWSHPHQIPRHLVRNWEINEFKTKLNGFWTR